MVSCLTQRIIQIQCLYCIFKHHLKIRKTFLFPSKWEEGQLLHHLLTKAHFVFQYCSLVLPCLYRGQKDMVCGSWWFYSLKTPLSWVATQAFFSPPLIMFWTQLQRCAFEAAFHCAWSSIWYSTLAITQYCPSAAFKLWAFDLALDQFSALSTSISQSQARMWV